MPLLNGPKGKSMLKPGSTIGILGGGQLGRMLAIEGARLGYRCVGLAPEGDNVASPVCDDFFTNEWSDKPALAAFAAQCDAITLEFENVPLAVADALPKDRLFPPRKALEVAQDRLIEKRFVADLGGRPAPHAAVDSRADLDADAEGAGTEAEALMRSLSARGKISIQDGEVRNIAFLANVERLMRMPGIFGLKDGKKRFQRLEGPFEIRKGKVRFPSLRLDSPGLSLNAKGEVGFDLQSRLDITATFDKKATRTLSKGLFGALLGAAEKLEIPFRVRGSLLAPRVALDPLFLQKSLGRNPEKFIRDVLDRLLR